MVNKIKCIVLLLRILHKIENKRKVLDRKIEENKHWVKGEYIFRKCHLFQHIQFSVRRKFSGKNCESPQTALALSWQMGPSTHLGCGPSMLSLWQMSCAAHSTVIWHADSETRLPGFWSCFYRLWSQELEENEFTFCSLNSLIPKVGLVKFSNL